MTQPYAGPYDPLIESTFRLCTWNLWWRFGPHERRLPAIEATLRRIDADVVCLQEVWTDLATRTSSATLLAEALGYPHVVAGHRLELDDGGAQFGFGNAILSRWPITDHAVLPLPSPPEVDEQRVCLRADLEGPRGPIQLATTHLHWRYDHGAIRVAQVEAICRWLDEAKPAGGRTYPLVLCGDFNAEPLSDEIRMLTGLAPVPVDRLVFHDAWRLAGDGGEGLTWDNRNVYVAAELEPDRRIDYVFVGWPKPGGAGNPVACRVEGLDDVDGIAPSDHLAVVADLRY